jgi:hypothetical protein
MNFLDGKKYLKESIALTAMFSLTVDGSCKALTTGELCMWRARRVNNAPLGIGQSFLAKTGTGNGLKTKTTTQGVGPESKATWLP